MILDLTNQQFFLLFVMWTAVIFIITSLTHTHDIDAEEVAIQSVDKLEEKVTEIVQWTSENTSDTPISVWLSWHKAPDGF